MKALSIYDKSVDQDGKLKEDVQGAVLHQAKRTVTVAQWVKQGQ